MHEIIQWARLTDLTTTVAALTQPTPAWMYLERVPSAWLTEAELTCGLRLEAFNPTEDWNVWERGRLFGMAFELRWEKQDGAFQTVYVGAPLILPEFGAGDLDLNGTQTTERAYRLWGNRVPKDNLADVGAEPPPGQTVFLEFVTPRVLYYPLDVERVALRVREYTDAQSGALLYYRFIGLEAADVSV